MKSSRFFVLFLTLAMLLCCLPVSAADTAWLIPKEKEAPAFSDVKGSWCESYVETVCEAGLMEGRTSDTFDPGGNLTIAQITVITARLHSLLNGGDGKLPVPAEGEAWYQPAMDYLKAHVKDAETIGPVLGTRLVQMETVPIYAVQNAPRQDLVAFLAAVLPETALTSINHITSLPDTHDEEELRFYNAGILNGSDEYGAFLGTRPLTRGQAAAILARVIDPSLRLTFTVKPFDLCRDVLGVEADTVFLTIDGTAVTAAQMARPLCGALRGWDPVTGEKFSVTDPANARDRAVAFIQQDFSLEYLLAEKKLTVDPIDPDTLSPYYGIPLEGCLWEKSHTNMYDALLESYEAQYGAVWPVGAPTPGSLGEIKLREDLSALMEDVTVQISPALETLDLTAVQSRLKSLSFAFAL